MKLKALIDDAFRANRHNKVPSIMQFKQIDIDGTARRLDLEAKARESGARDLPASDSVTLDRVEQTIVAEIEAEGQRDYAKYLDHQRTYADRAGTHGIESLLIEIGASARAAIADFTNRIQNGLNQLYLLRKDVIETERELEAYRARHRLSRPARNLGPATLKVGIILMILVAEMIANGVIFAEGSEGGLIEGFGIALVIAVFNVLIGVIAGRMALYWLAYRHWGVRLLALTGLVLYAVAAVYFNLAVGHFRAAVVATDVAQAASMAYKTLIANPLGIADLKSWMLFGIGMVCSLIAMIDGWMMNDPYPGYGLRARHHREAAEIYAEQNQELFAELEELNNAATKTIEERMRDIGARRGEYDYILASSHSLQLAMEQHLDHLETSVNTLLRIYRTENQKYRKTAAPARFDEPWTYRRPQLGGHAIPTSIRDQIESAVRRATEEVPRLHGEVIAAYEAAMAKYRRIDELTARDLEQNG